MIPRVTVLQLDTDFPRVAGDVGSADSYARAPQIIRIAGAHVGDIVRHDPARINIAPFADALSRATGDIIVTSCGFLSYWQETLAAMTDKPFISSALTALDHLCLAYQPAALRILTFDAARLGPAHLGRHAQFAASIIGLRPDDHLRTVIRGNQHDLDTCRARDEIIALLREGAMAEHQHILLECTNLPPYHAAIGQATGLGVTDILTQIERTCPGAVAAQFR